LGSGENANITDYNEEYPDLLNDDKVPDVGSIRNR
jgi:hypothetical protein